MNKENGMGGSVMSTDNQSAQSRKAFEDAVFNAYFFKSIKRNPNPPRGTGAMDFIATATKTQAELCERDGESYKDEAVSAMWFGWGLAARSALAQAPATSGEALTEASTRHDALAEGLRLLALHPGVAQAGGRKLLESAAGALASPGAMEGAQAAQPLSAIAAELIDGYKAGLAGEGMGLVSAAFDSGWTFGAQDRAAHPSTGEPT